MLSRLIIESFTSIQTVKNFITQKTDLLLMDEFSSKTTCVTTRKMKISEKFLDEFWFANKG